MKGRNLLHISKMGIRNKPNRFKLTEFQTTVNSQRKFYSDTDLCEKLLNIRKKVET